MVDALIFIPFIVIAITQGIKELLPTINGWLTRIIAVLVGVLVAILAPYIGVGDISIAAAIMAAVAAIGGSDLARKAAGNG